MKNTSVPDWLPDWRDETKYPYHTNLKVWAWEFLRRNQEYQEDWEMVLANKGMWCVDGDIHDLRCEADERCMGAISTSPIEVVIAKKWGFSRYVLDPATQPDEYPMEFSGYPLLSEISCFEDHDGTTHPRGYSPKSYKEIALVFDLELPLEPQLKKAAFQLKGRQKYLAKKSNVSPIKAKINLELYPNYLRCFDAKLREIPDSEISAVLLPDKDADIEYRDVKNYCNAAKKLVSGDYRKIPIRWSPKPE